MILILLAFIIFVAFVVFMIYRSIKENYKNSIITFIIPTIGRDTLRRTINSLINLNIKNWKALIIFDGIEPNIKVEDERIKIIKLEKKMGEGRNSAGNVRNHAYQFVDTPWVGFVDDDDTLNRYYIDNLEKEIKNDKSLDLLIFRMIYEGGLILPRTGDKDFKMNEVGISFCLKTSIAKEFLFVPDGSEDFYLLNKIRENKKKIIISDYIGYNAGF